MISGTINMSLALWASYILSNAIWFDTTDSWLPTVAFVLQVQGGHMYMYMCWKFKYLLCTVIHIYIHVQCMYNYWLWYPHVCSLCVTWIDSLYQVHVRTCILAFKYPMSHWCQAWLSACAYSISLSIAVRADSGTIGGSLSHEYHIPYYRGEDTLVICQK